MVKNILMIFNLNSLCQLVLVLYSGDIEFNSLALVGPPGLRSLLGLIVCAIAGDG